MERPLELLGKRRLLKKKAHQRMNLSLESRAKRGRVLILTSLAPVSTCNWKWSPGTIQLCEVKHFLFASVSLRPKRSNQR